MMDFVLLTLSFMVAMLGAGFIAVFIVMNKHVMGWYLKKVNKLTSDIMEEMFDVAADSEEEEL